MRESVEHLTNDSESELLFRRAWALLESGSDVNGFKTLLDAAEKGHLEAQSAVGYLFDVGRGTRRSEAAALSWYRRAARRGDASAANNIAIIHRDNGSRRLALSWFRKALDLGLGDVLLEIARLKAATRRGTPAAVRQLRRLLRRRDIAAVTREEAAELLAQLLNSRSTPPAGGRPHAST